MLLDHELIGIIKRNFIWTFILYFFARLYCIYLSNRNQLSHFDSIKGHRKNKVNNFAKEFEI